MPRRKPAEGLNYHRTIHLYLTTGDGHICTVGECPARAFATLMRVAAATANNPEAAAKSIVGLDYNHPIDRWYAIDVLTSHGAAIPLFATSDEAARAGLSTEVKV